MLRVAGGQLGPVQRDHSRADVVERLIALLRRAAEAECELIVFPELALTTFFPRWFLDDISEADHFYETSMPNEATQPLFDEATRLGVGFCLGYALLERDGDAKRRWNVQTLVERDGSIVATFKKVHIPGHAGHEPDRPFQHAERYYFEPSPHGFGVWDAFGARVGMMICNDRRWPESYREMGLQGGLLLRRQLPVGGAAEQRRGGEIRLHLVVGVCLVHAVRSASAVSPGSCWAARSLWSAANPSGPPISSAMVLRALWSRLITVPMGTPTISAISRYFSP